MRWIDIDLSEQRITREAGVLITQAAELAAAIPALQERDGLDGRAVVDQMKAAGRLLFRAVLAVDQEAFRPDAGAPQTVTPGAENGPVTGYHLVTGSDHVGLPWFWLHNGLEFLAVKHPICAAEVASAPDADDRPWMQRLVRAGFLVGSDGDTSLESILPEMNAGGPLGPELLFVPGHTEEAIRRLIYREAEAIETALASAHVTGHLADPLARLRIPADAITPSQLPELGLAYQAIHFAGPTSQPARPADAAGEYWMNRLLEEAVAPEDHEIDEAVGLEGEVLGVDPITSLLDDVCEKFDRSGGVAEPVPPLQRGAAGTAPGGRTAARKDRHHWLLPDGPVDPETIGSAGGIPPLVFSNSYRALPELGHRFLNAGASAFVGPLVPLFSRPARRFAGHCYEALGEGWCVGGAVWKAANACREELGPNHPAWLSYGLQGYGSLALQYL